MVAATRSRVQAGLVVAVLLLSGSGCGAFRYRLDDAALEVLTDYIALLGAGKAEAAGELDTYDLSTDLPLSLGQPCAELLTDEAYATVENRPTNFEVVSGYMPSDNEASIDVTLDVAGYSGVDMTYYLTRAENGEWLVENRLSRSPRGAEMGSFDVVNRGVGGWIHGDELRYGGAACSGELRVLDQAAYPGTWTVSYSDVLGVGQAQERTFAVTGVAFPLEVGRAMPNEVVFEAFEPEADFVANLDAQIAALVDECVAGLLDVPACPTDVLETVFHHPVTIEQPAAAGHPESTLTRVDDEWHFVTTDFPLSWTDARGTEHDSSLSYRGAVSIDSSGALVVTRDPET